MNKVNANKYPFLLFIYSSVNTMTCKLMIMQLGVIRVWHNTIPVLWECPSEDVAFRNN